MARRGVGLPADLMAGAPDELLQFLQQALGGQLPPGLRLSGSGGGGGSGEEEEAQEEEEVGAGWHGYGGKKGLCGAFGGEEPCSGR